MTGSTRRRTGTSTTTAAALLAVGALVLGGCGPVDPTLGVDTHAGALDAIVDSFSGSFRWEARLDAHVDDDDLAAIDADEYVRDDLARLDEIASGHAHGALGEDGSWQTTLVDGDREWLDVRVGLAELVTASTLEPDVDVYVRLDLGHVLRMWGGGFVTPELVRMQALEALADTPASLRDVVLGVLDGRWGGLTGTLDLAAYDVTEDDLAQVRATVGDQLSALTDRDTLIELLDAAVTVRGFAPDGDGGGSVAVVDVHPREADAAVRGLVGGGTAGGGPAADDLPDTLEAVATIAFGQDGHVTGVVVDLLSVARQVADHQASRGGEERRAEDAEQLHALTRSHLDLELRFSDHGGVATVLDVDDAVTTSWVDVVDWLGWVVPVPGTAVEAEPYDVDELERPEPDQMPGAGDPLPDDRATTGSNPSDGPGGPASTDGPAVPDQYPDGTANQTPGTAPTPHPRNQTDGPADPDGAANPTGDQP